MFLISLLIFFYNKSETLKRVTKLLRSYGRQKALKFSLLKSCLDLFKAIGVKKDDNIRYNIKTIMDEKT